MSSPRSLQLLELLLSGHQLSVAELDDLIIHQVEEDLYVEYKHGNELQNSEANDTIRKYLSAFANSAGGILIIGVNAPQRIPIEITGCNGHSKGKLDDWAARCLTPIASTAGRKSSSSLGPQWTARVRPLERLCHRPVEIVDKIEDACAQVF